MFGYGNSIVQQDLSEMAGSSVAWSRFDGKTVFITGANSMLGTYTAYLFLYLKQHVGIDVRTVVLTRSLDKTRALFREVLHEDYFGIVNQDIASPISYEGHADYIFHFAGNASPYFINSDPVGIMKSNLLGTFNVMDFARRSASGCVVFASTREVYGATEGKTLLDENSFGYLDPLDNRSCYPESKRAAETVLRSYYLQHGIRAVSVRIAHSYGPGMKTEGDGRVMADFIGDALNGRDIVLKSAGDAVRAFCYVSDAVMGLVYSALYGKGGEAYNLANETEPMPIRDVAGLICQAVPERGIAVRFENNADMTGYCNYTRVALDTAKIESLGFRPSVGLREGIYRTLKSFE